MQSRNNLTRVSMYVCTFGVFTCLSPYKDFSTVYLPRVNVRHIYTPSPRVSIRLRRAECSPCPGSAAVPGKAPPPHTAIPHQLSHDAHTVPGVRGGQGGVATTVRLEGGGVACGVCLGERGGARGRLHDARNWSWTGGGALQTDGACRRTDGQG